MSTVLIGDGHLSVCVDPGRGGALTSLRTDGLEWLARGTSRAKITGTDFAETGYRGWDECFPSIRATRASEVSGVVPDHGWAWSRPWTIDEQAESRAAMSVDIPELGCVLRRRAEVTSRSLRLDYSVHAGPSQDVNFVWAGHGLFAGADDLVLPGLPAPVHVESTSATDGRLQPWPTRGGLHRWSDVPADTYAKWYAPWPTAGVALERSSRRLTLRARRADGGPLFLGVWQNRAREYGGSGHGHLGLEPTIGNRDDLRQAAAQGTSKVAPAGTSFDWHVVLDFD